MLTLQKAEGRAWQAERTACAKIVKGKGITVGVLKFLKKKIRGAWLALLEKLLSVVGGYKFEPRVGCKDPFLKNCNSLVISSARLISSFHRQAPTG